MYTMFIEFLSDIFLKHTLVLFPAGLKNIPESNKLLPRAFPRNEILYLKTKYR